MTWFVSKIHHMELQVLFLRVRTLPLVHLCEATHA